MPLLMAVALTITVVQKKQKVEVCNCDIIKLRCLQVLSDIFKDAGNDAWDPKDHDILSCQAIALWYIINEPGATLHHFEKRKSIMASPK